MKKQKKKIKTIKKSKPLNTPELSVKYGWVDKAQEMTFGKFTLIIKK